MKVAVKLRKPDPIWEPYVKQLRDHIETVVLYDGKLEEVYEGIDVLITTNVSADTLDRFPNLRQIFLFKTGMDNLPLDALAQRGITVRCSHANSDVIAEHALTLALTLLHRTVEFHRDLCNGIWYADGSNFSWQSIGALRTGILGYGSIGRSLYPKLKGLCKDVLVLNRSGHYPNDIPHAQTFDELLRNCDLIFVCLPKTNETVHLFDETVFDQMQGKYLVNIGRADIVSEKALFEALKSRRLAGFASDVWFREPDKSNRSACTMPAHYPLWEFKNVVMSPHCATHEQNAHERYIRDAVNACLAYAVGEK